MGNFDVQVLDLDRDEWRTNDVEVVALGVLIIEGCFLFTGQRTNSFQGAFKRALGEVERS